MVLVLVAMAGEPREFGPYRLVRRLGVGGMAETFEATRIGAGGFAQRVCLKRVLPAFSDDEEFVSRFQREAKLAARLRHTNIVGVIDAGEIDGAHYMALELVDGVDLRSLLKSSPGERLSPDTVALIGMDLAYALEHAHGALVHRDISPSNILLSRSGEAKLADFGIAKAIDNANVTASRSAKGKIPYMAPERMRGESVDGRADLFSLGVVLFEALSGARPFDGVHDVETMRKILEGDRVSLSEAAPDAPEQLRKVVERLIEVDVDARIQSANELLDQLAAVAPLPAVRQALAATVEEHRGGPEARLHVRAAEEERDTELTRVPGVVAESAPDLTAKNRVRRPWLFAAFLAAVATTLVVVSQRAAETPAPETRIPEPSDANAGPVADADADADAVAVTDADADADAGADAGAVTGAGAVTDTGAVTGAVTDTGAEAGADTDADTAPAPVSRGSVRVVVQPWGNVWIDGKFFGRAPVRARLPKGRHVVAAGHEIPTVRRIVWARPGARKEVELTLSEE